MAHKVKRESVRTSEGELKHIETVHDEQGNVIHKRLSRRSVEFYPRDLLQVIIGSTLLATPIAFTEEVWAIGSYLPIMNTLLIIAVSLIFISSFVYYNYYKNNLEPHLDEFIKRVLSTYIFSFIVVAMILTLIEQGPWIQAPLIAFKRSVLVALPASMSAAVADMIK